MSEAQAHLDAVIDVQQVVGIHARVQQHVIWQRAQPPVCQLVLLVCLQCTGSASAPPATSEVTLAHSLLPQPHAWALT